MRFAGSELAKDPHFIAAAAKTNPASFALVSDKHRDDKKIVLAAVAADARTLRYASSRLKKDKDVRAVAGVDDRVNPRDFGEVHR